LVAARPAVYSQAIENQAFSQGLGVVSTFKINGLVFDLTAPNKPQKFDLLTRC
jgi:hypothetical protein